MRIVPINRILPEGDIFGSVDDDEFKVNVNGEDKGVFKRFEYMSVPFSITSNIQLFDEIYNQAQINNTSFKKELSNNSEATNLVNYVFDKMDNNSSFTKQTLDQCLGKVFVDDNIISKVDVGNIFYDNLSKINFSWKHLADFYCIEGLVGGDGENNIFNNASESSLISGAIDSLETNLPLLKNQLSEMEWNKVCLKLSSVIGRDYKQINSAIDIIGLVFGKEGKLSNEEINNSLKLIDEFSNSAFTSNRDLGKLYNSIIRFHNWMPNNLKVDENVGGTYDSICIPTKNALDFMDKSTIEYQSIDKIQDATSPKGLALLALVDEGKIPGKDYIAKNIKTNEERFNYSIENGRKDFSSFSFEDSTFYTSLTGGKYKGLKLLHDAKEVLNLKYDVPNAHGISSLFFEDIFNKVGISKILKENMFSINKETRNEIIDLIDSTDLEKSFDKSLLDKFEDSMVVRSSMYGEDGFSNFSGTYESFTCNKDNFFQSMKDVVKSYFSMEAIKSREDIGLAHIPGVSCIVQNKVEGIGGVIHLTNGNSSISFADSPEEAVLGNGNHKSKKGIAEIVKGTKLETIKDDLTTLYDTFGDSDIEFVIDKYDNVNLIQMRPKYEVPNLVSRDFDTDKKVLYNISELRDTKLDKKYIVQMDFLGRENIMDKEGEIMDFIRENKEYIVAVEGKMSCVAHIPNKIEGHFKIPYLMKNEVEK